MRSEHWLKSSLVVTGLEVTSPEQLIDAVSSRVATATGIATPSILDALTESVRAEGWSLGGGVAIPHAELEGLEEPLVCLVVTRTAMSLPSIDGRAPDVFFFILAPRDNPEQHLLLLARLARLAQSRTLIEGLRKAPGAEEAITLVKATELRHTPAAAGTAVAPGSECVMILIAIAGEKAVDALLVELLDRELVEATIVEAQSLREATTREVPLFAGFHDIFGDPGGRRVILLDVAAARAPDIVQAVQRIAVERRARDVRVSVFPLQMHWQLVRAAEEDEAGHG